MIEILREPKNKDPAKLGNVAANLFDSMDHSIVDVDRVCTVSSFWPHAVMVVNINDQT